jgi:hypothetical protein
MLTVTQEDNAKPAKDAIDRSQAAEIARFAPPTDLWSLYLQEANERAKAKVDLWNGSLGAFLLFVSIGLASLKIILIMIGICRQVYLPG